MSLCVLAAAGKVVLAGTTFTLSWLHSVEKIRWEEDWRIGPAGLVLAEARVKGSGAGMEPPAEARLKDGWWVYRPALAPQSRLLLAASGETTDGWRICSNEECVTVGASSGVPVTVSVCETGQ